jgi:hypothetical protein
MERDPGEAYPSNFPRSLAGARNPRAAHGRALDYLFARYSGAAAPAAASEASRPSEGQADERYAAVRTETER